MQSFIKVIKIAVAFLVVAIGVASGVYYVHNALSNPVAVHEDTATDPKGVYEIYNNTVVTGEQVLTAQLVYGNYDEPEPNKGLCRIQTGETRTAYENGTGSEWSDYTQVKNKDNPSYVNPVGQFQANLVYGSDLPATPENIVIIKNYPNELQWIEFRQISTRNVAKPNVAPKEATPEPTLATEEELEDVPDVVQLIATGGMELWEGTKISDITPKKQGVTITYGGVDITNEVEWPDWNPTITNGEEKQQKTFTIRYKGKTAKIIVNFYKALAVTVSAESTIDGHPVTVTTNHPTLSSNIFSTNDSSVDFRFIADKGETDLAKMFKTLSSSGAQVAPSSGDYVVANIKQGGASGVATASMTVGVEEPKYKATREDSKKINWSIFEVTYFNQTADEAYQNSGNYTDEETGIIGGAKDANAGYESLIAQGDIVTLTCNTVADVSYKGSGILDKLLGNTVYSKADPVKDYSGSALQNSVATLKAEKATDAGEAKVTFTDKVTKFTATTDEKFWTIYTPFSFDVPSYNLNTGKKLVRDDKYTETDIVIDGSGSIATSNDKKMYFTKWYSVNDNGVAVHDFTFASFSYADSEDAKETARAVNGQKNNYTLECNTRYDGKDISTNKQGREHFTAVYVDFGSRYTKEKVVYVWYPLDLEFTRPNDLAWDRNENYSKVPLEEAIVATANQNDTLFTWSTSVANSSKISLGVDNEIKVADYETDAPCKAAITNTFSSRSFAFTMTKDGTITPTVTRDRTGETVTVAPIEFITTVPDAIYNLTSADKTRSDVTNTTVVAVNEETNRLACGDKFNYGDSIPVESVSFKVYKGNSTRKKTLDNPDKTLLCECVSDGTTLDVSKSGGIVMVGNNYISIAQEDSDTFYAIEFEANSSAYWFVDNPVTKFESTEQGTMAYNVYRFEDSYANTVSSGTKQSDGEYEGLWCYADKAVVLAHQYTTSFSSSKAENVVMNLASKTIKNHHDTNSYKSSYKKTNADTALTITTNKGSILGTDTEVTVSHEQFYGRTKTIAWKAFTKLDNSLTLTELHEGSVELGEAKGLNCILLSKLGGGSYEDVEKREDTDATKYNSNRTQLQYVGKSISNGKTKLRIIAKKVGDTEVKNMNYKIKNKMNNQEYTIKVTVKQFEAKAYQVLNDNFGYDWYNSKGEKLANSKGKNVLIDNQSILVGDVIALAANTSGFNMSYTNNKKATIKHISNQDTSGSAFTTRKVVSEDAEGFSLDNDISDFEKVKFYTTDFPSDYENNIYSNPSTITITDNGISTYYTTEAPADVGAENSAKVKITYRENPSLWAITGQYARKGCEPGSCEKVSNSLHEHIQSWAFTNTTYHHFATYSGAGTALKSTDLISGLCKKGNVAYLNVSNWNNGTSKADNVLAWTSGKKSFVTYKTIKFTDSASHPSVGFTAKMDGTDTNYVYIVPANCAPKDCYTLFTVKYRIHSTSGTGKWKYVDKNGDSVLAATVNESTNAVLNGTSVENRSDLKDCIFTYTSGTTIATTLHYPFVCSLNEDACDEDNPNGQIKYTNNANKIVKVGKYGTLTSQTNTKVYTEQGTANDIGCIRIDANSLGWLGDSVKSVDIQITFISNKELNRSYTFPFTFYNSAAPEEYDHNND